MENRLSKFAKTEEPDRMVFIANLNHLMWYNDGCFAEVKTIVEKWEKKSEVKAVFFPKLDS